MVHTLPAWSTKYRMVKVFGNIDNNELAARTGALSLFDRRGDTLFYDNFENGLGRWRLWTASGAGSVVCTTSRCFTGSTCVKCTTPASVVNVGITKSFLNGYSTKLGLECMVLVGDEAVEFSIAVYGYKGTEFFMGEVLYDTGDDKLYYTDSGNNYVELADDIYTSLLNECWIPIKLAIDYGTNKYLRVICGDNEYDLSTKSL